MRNTPPYIKLPSRRLLSLRRTERRERVSGNRVCSDRVHGRNRRGGFGADEREGRGEEGEGVVRNKQEAALWSAGWEGVKRGGSGVVVIGTSRVGG